MKRLSPYLWGGWAASLFWQLRIIAAYRTAGTGFVWLYDANIYYAAGYSAHAFGWVYGEPIRYVFIVLVHLLGEAFPLAWWSLMLVAYVSISKKVVEIPYGIGWILALLALRYTRWSLWAGNIFSALAWLLTAPMGIVLAPMVKLYLAPLAIVCAGCCSYVFRPHEDARPGWRSICAAAGLVDFQSSTESACTARLNHTQERG